jgi:hypothetical protein
MTEQHEHPAFNWNKFAAWCIVGMGVFVAAISVAIQHWRTLLSAVAAIALGASYLHRFRRSPES